MQKQMDLGGTFTLPGTSMPLNRMGYGAMQLAGPQVWGPPRDVDHAIAVLREAVAAGVNHIDTSDFYGPHVTNEIIKRALHPYPDDLVIVTKVGARRGPDKSWPHALSRQELIDAVQDNLRNLGLDKLDVVNLRVGGRSRADDRHQKSRSNNYSKGRRSIVIRTRAQSNSKSFDRQRNRSGLCDFDRRGTVDANIDADSSRGTGLQSGSHTDISNQL